LTPPYPTPFSHALFPHLSLSQTQGQFPHFFFFISFPKKNERNEKKVKKVKENIEHQKQLVRGPFPPFLKMILIIFERKKKSFH